VAPRGSDPGPIAKLWAEGDPEGLTPDREPPK
jgi:hypothetical protein